MDNLQQEVEDLLQQVIQTLMDKRGLSKERAYEAVYEYSGRLYRFHRQGHFQKRTLDNNVLQDIWEKARDGVYPTPAKGFVLTYENKLPMILALRNLTGMGLKDAKKAVEVGVFKTPPPGLAESFTAMGGKVVFLPIED